MQENVNLFHGNDKGADQSVYSSSLIRAYAISIGTTTTNSVKIQ